MTALDAFEQLITTVTPQVIVLHPDDYRLAVEEAMRLESNTQVRLTPNKNLCFSWKGVVFMKGKYSPANINEAQ